MLYYLSNGEFPGRQAHTIQQVRMCEAFEQNGESTTLVHPSYGWDNPSFDELAAFYDLEAEFDIQTVPSFPEKNSVPNVPTSGEVTMWLWLLAAIASGRISSSDVLYSRNIVPTYALIRAKQFVPKSRWPTIIFEQHQVYEDNPLVNEAFYNRLDGVVCIANQLRDRIVDRYGGFEYKIFVAHDGMCIEPYERISTQEGRKLLGLPLEESIVMYTGHLYPGKEVEQLVRIAPEINAQVYIVGGYEKDIDRIRRGMPESEHVTFTGFVSPSDIQKYQIAADVLVATADPDAEYYSPLKLFEYMAAGKPIVATRTLAFEEVLEHETNCLFVEPGDSKALLKQIEKVLDRTNLATDIAHNAHEKAYSHTWYRRSSKILEYVDGVT